MLFVGSNVILCHGVFDLRKGASGLLGLLDQPEKDTWYLFSNRRRSLVKCVRMDEQGYWMASRRLKQGHFYWIERVAASTVIKASQAQSICDGAQLKRQFE